MRNIKQNLKLDQTLHSGKHNADIIDFTFF